MTEEIYERELLQPETQQILKKLINSKIEGHDQRKELLQRSNVKILEKYTSYNDQSKFVNWAVTITNFTIKAYIKKCAESKVVYDSEMIRALHNVIDEQYKPNYDFEQVKSEVNGVVSKLTKERQEVFNLLMQGLKPREIEVETGLGIKNIYQIKQDVTKILKTKLQNNKIIQEYML
jgi:RNA polymerase sigma factor (sigma-70 family)